jgi:Zn-dependent peptidase ImmA (M78 family)
MPAPQRVRYTKIAQLVERLLDKNGVSGPAVPVEKIAKAEGLIITKKSLDGDTAGFLLRSPGAKFIGVNQAQAPTRQRFTIAHELGHALLHDGEELHVDKDFRINFRDVASSLATNVEEIESNTFAAWLLMPSQFLINQITSEHLDIDDGKQVVKLAKRYNVSAQAMTYRLANLSTQGM